RCAGVDGVDAALIPESVKLSVLYAEIHTYNHGVWRLQSGDAANFAEPRGGALPEAQQPLIRRQGKDRQLGSLDEAGAISTVRIRGNRLLSREHSHDSHQNPHDYLHRKNPPCELFYRSYLRQRAKLRIAIRKNLRFNLTARCKRFHRRGNENEEGTTFSQCCAVAQGWMRKDFLGKS